MREFRLRAQAFTETYRVLLYAVLVYSLVAVLLLEVYPPPLPDEMFFAPAARSLLSAGTLSTPVIVGLENYTYWVPPFYLISLAGFFYVAGFGFLQLRIFSLLCGLVVLMQTFAIARRLRFELGFLVVVLLLVVLDPFFLRLSKLGRMDSICLMWILGALSFHLRWMEDRKRVWDVMSMCFAVLAVTTHPMGVVAPLGLMIHRGILRLRGQIGSSSVALPLVALGTAVLLLSAHWAQSPQDAVTQLSFQLTRKTDRGIFTSMQNWVERYWSLPALLFCSVAGLAGAVVGLGKSGWSRGEGAVVISALLAMTLAVFSYELFYPLYYIPLVALCVAFCLKKIWETKGLLFKRSAGTIVGFALVNSLLFTSYFGKIYLGDLRQFTSVFSIGREADMSLPAGATVLLIGAPCLYFEFTEHRPDLRLFTPPAMTESHEEFLADRIDYIVVTEGFGAQYTRYIEGELQYWNEALTESGRIAQVKTTMGFDAPYAYRGKIYEIHPLAK